MTRQILLSIIVIAASFRLATADTLPIHADVERQPMEAAIIRVVEALSTSGEAIPQLVSTEISELGKSTEDRKVVRRLQELLDPFCLVGVEINPESRVTVKAGPASPHLVEKGWRTFLVKVINTGGVTAALRCSSPQAEPMVVASSGKPQPILKVSPAESERRWLDLKLPTSEPLRPTLSGLQVEYRLIQLYSRDAGSREATLAFDVGQGTQDLGFRNQVPILFRCQSSVEIPLVIRDFDGRPTTCSLLIRDEQDRVYPNPSRRLAPDFFFHHQIYRRDGETVRLPPGKYHIAAFRGPEYDTTNLDVTIREGQPVRPIEVKLKRWIHMTDHGWYSGDHHVHAAGCAHYESPTEGVLPEDMIRHIIGEDLNVGCVLSWGPCWYHQKQFFEGATSQLSLPTNLMRYDVEVSGFPSSHAGHLCLLNLREDDYPNAKTIEEWPSWTLPVLKWGQQQGGVVGYSHSGWGLALPDYLPNGERGTAPASLSSANRSGRPGRAADKLPDYAMPPFDSIGANEYIVTVAHNACDFISSVDTPAIWELNIWYHTLNCGFKTRLSGETDFPCIYGERVGLGRVYTQMAKNEPLTYEKWIDAVKLGRSYVGDGLSHLLKFDVQGVSMGHPGTSGEISQLSLRQPETVKIQTQVAAMLPRESSAEGKAIAARRLDEKPYWHLERSRIAESRRVPVELIVNGEVAAKQEIDADGQIKDLSWQIPIQRSSWVAVRVFPSMHSNPVFVEVAGEGIRASRRSAEWCRQAVDVCWGKKRPQIRASELVDAEAAYDHARKVFDKIILECKTP